MWNRHNMHVACRRNNTRLLLYLDIKKLICSEQVTNPVITHTYLGWTLNFQVNYQNTN